MTTATPAQISIDGVTVQLGEVRALDGLSVQTADRRIGIVGRNGSGKSTLARVLCGLIAPEAGQTRVGGVDVLADRKAAIRTVGMLFQNPDHQIIFPTVDEEISFGLRQLGQGKEAAADATAQMLAQFGKSHWAGRSVATLSQGQRHLVCLMAVLAMDPAVIVLDEPFSGLDIPTTRALTRYLEALPQTLVHITHDPAVIAGYDRVIWLERGKVAGDGAPSTVLPAYRAAMEEETPDAGADL